MSNSNRDRFWTIGVTAVLILLIAVAIAFSGGTNKYTASYQPVVPVLPLYGANHDPRSDVNPAQAQQDVDPEALQLLRQIAGDVRALREMAEGAPVAPAQQQQGPLTPAELVQVKCAKCHTAGVREAPKGDFALFELSANGQLTPVALEEGERARSHRRVRSGTMPPPDAKVNFTEKNRQDIVDYFGGKQ